MDARGFASISALGVVTIAAYGAWFYSFGVLLDPIIEDTGWSESSLTSTFGFGLGLGAVLSIPAGRTLDRLGSAPMFALTAVVSGIGFWIASVTTSILVFAISTGVGAAVTSAVGFYHVTQPTAVRVVPNEPTKAIAWLTIYGAVSSTIYLPSAAFLVSRYGWRPSLQIMATVTSIVLLAAAMVVRERPQPVRNLSGPGLSEALRDPYIRRFAGAFGLAGIALGIILVYQVPVMTANGLPLGTAATLAGVRGASQLTGRIPLNPMVRRLGARRSLRLAYAAIVVGLGLLAFSSSVLVGVVYALVAGFGIGAASPLGGINADEIFDRARLGMFMGYLGAIGTLATALGPAIAGALVDSTGQRWWAVVVGSAAAAAAYLLLGPPVEHPRQAVRTRSGF